MQWGRCSAAIGACWLMSWLPHTPAAGEQQGSRGKGPASWGAKEPQLQAFPWRPHSSEKGTPSTRCCRQPDSRRLAPARQQSWQKCLALTVDKVVGGQVQGGRVPLVMFPGLGHRLGAQLGVAVAAPGQHAVVGIVPVQQRGADLGRRGGQHWEGVWAVAASGQAALEPIVPAGPAGSSGLYRK